MLHTQPRRPGFERVRGAEVGILDELLFCGRNLDVPVRQDQEAQARNPPASDRPYLTLLTDVVIYLNGMGVPLLSAGRQPLL